MNSGLSLPQFLVVYAAEFLPRDCLVTLSMTSKGCCVIASQELHHRRRVNPHPPTGTFTRALELLPGPIGHILHRWKIHLTETINMAQTPLDRRPSIPGMELGGEVAEKVDIEWGVKFPQRDNTPVHWIWKTMFGDGEDETPCAFLGCGVMPTDTIDMYCISVTCAQRMTCSVGGITYVTVALLLDANGYVVDLTWSFVMSASVVLALRSPTSENELIFSSHPTVFGHLHQVQGIEEVRQDVPVPLQNLAKFRIPLPPRSNRSSFHMLLSLMEGAADHQLFVHSLCDNFIAPISNSVANIDDELYTIKGLTRDLTTPKGIWKIESGEADVTLVDVPTLWQRRAEKQLHMVEKASHEVRGLITSGVIPLGTLLCMDIIHSDPTASPSQIYLA